MADNGWGPHGVTPAQSGPLRDTTNIMTADTTNNGHGEKTEKDTTVNNQEIKLSDEPGQWGKVTPYDYEGLTNRDNTTWDGNARIYEWDGEVGDVGPEYPELEIMLFGQPGDREHHGIDFTKQVTSILAEPKASILICSQDHGTQALPRGPGSRRADYDVQGRGSPSRHAPQC